MNNINDITKASLSNKALFYAKEKHSSTNHIYDDKPYEYHLWMVYDTAKMFINYIGEPYREIVYAACWLHDTIEDCRVTYNDIKKEFGEEVAEIVYALTNEKGKNRRERANEKYYNGIRDTFCASFVKICDRIANIKHSLETKSSMLEKYKEENNHFHQSIDPDDAYEAMWSYIKHLFWQ